MKKKLILAFMVSPWAANAQTVQWAAKVNGVSSEYIDKNDSKPYKAEQVLGRPNVLPSVEGSGCAWSPATKNNGLQWISVGFDKPEQIRQVAVGESNNGGALSEVVVYGAKGEAETVYENPAQKKMAEGGKMTNIFFNLTSFPVTSVKITLNTQAVDGWNHIDCIGISASDKPVKAEIALLKNFKAGIIEALPELNSPYDEVVPVISPDGKTIYFDRKNHPGNVPGMVNDDIWQSNSVGGIWDKPQRMPAPLNDINHNFVSSVTPDGNTLLLGNVYEKGAALAGLSLSHKTSGGWSVPAKINIENFYNLSRFSEFSMANNQKAIIMAIQREDGYGLRDLYVSLRRKDGSWEPPKNMGAQVNSAGVEITPFLASDGVTLYYSTNGRSGYGSNDMYMTKRLDNSWINWSDPVNLGPEINSAKWESAYSMDAKGEYAYFVKSQTAENTNSDIYRIRLPQEARPEPVALIYGRVYDAKTGKPIQAEVRYENLGTGQDSGYASSSPGEGLFKIALPFKNKYGVRATAPGYFSVHENLDLSQTGNYVEVEQNLYLSPMEVGQAVALNNVFFELSAYKLLPESHLELDRLAQIMLENPSIKIELGGHTEKIGNAAQNKTLSGQRAQSVKDYMIKKGIATGRIEVVAYGDTRPATDKTDAESRKKNRRVEFKIIAK